MDKRLILSVAGSGKTTEAISKLNTKDRFLLITYTRNNYDNIRHRVIDKFQCVPDNIRIYTYFTFLYSFCFKPFFLRKTNAKGISFKPCVNYSATGIARYQNSKSRMMYSNRLAEFIVEFADLQVNDRIKKYFDYLIIDEIQDFASRDFDFILKLTEIDCNILYIGDFYQHTYSSSQDALKGKNLFKKGESNYINQFQKNISIDKKTLSKSYRCSKTVCEFVKNRLGINIDSHCSTETTVQFIDKDDEILKIYKNNNIVKLFYKNHQQYIGNTNNWGASKGINSYVDVCVVLNDGTKKKFPDNLNSLASLTKNKLYVAITRASNNVYFVCEKQLKRVIDNDQS